MTEETTKILFKLQYFCAYRERCTQEVLQKLRNLDASKEAIAEIIPALEEENFLNDKRFANIYADNKFRLKKWGRNKIIQNLTAKKIPPYLIDEAISQIVEEDYLAMMRYLLEKKKESLKETDTYQRKVKIARYLLQKGYESALIWKLLGR